MSNNLACRVCGYLQDDPPWGENGNCPNYDICDCCGVEFGYEDCNLTSILTFRNQWLKNGAKWKNFKYKPINWSLEEQIKNIPKEFK